MTGGLWWSRLVNSVRFLDDIQDALTEYKSVLLLFDNDIPWQDIMIETIEARLNEHIDSKTFDVLDVSKVESPGQYLMERYCSKDERKKYWPTTHGSPEKFLAQNRATPLNKRYVCLTGVRPHKAADWVSSITEYLENCDSTQEHGVFIIIVEGAGVSASKYLTAFKYSDYVTDYDCMMLCLTMVSDLSCSRAEKMYLCEVASNIAHNHVELAALLVSEKLKLLQNPTAVAESTYQENGIKVTNLQEVVRMAVWEAQIKLVFPKLENFRAEIIRKYEAKLQRFLPIRSSNNDKIDRAADLEIGQLFYVCKENRDSKITEYAEYEMIRKMRDARNTLAHWEILSYEQLKELGMI